MNKANIPLNQEHKEAEQMNADQERKEFMATLSKKEKAQFKAVEKAVETLVKVEVLFYLFPYLPSSHFKGKSQVWQWKSLNAFVQYGEDGKPTTESLEKNGIYHEAFFSFLFNQFSHLFNGETFEQKLDAVPYFFYHCLKRHKDYLDSKEPQL